MSTKETHNCCLGCQIGKPGQNQHCKVRLLKEEQTKKALSQKELEEKYS